MTVAEHRPAHCEPATGRDDCVCACLPCRDERCGDAAHARTLARSSDLVEQELANSIMDGTTETCGFDSTGAPLYRGTQEARR